MWDISLLNSVVGVGRNLKWAREQDNVNIPGKSIQSTGNNKQKQNPLAGVGYLLSVAGVGRLEVGEERETANNEGVVKVARSGRVKFPR